MTKEELHSLKPGDFIFITDNKGCQRVEIVSQVLDDELYTVGSSKDITLEKSSVASITSFAQLENYPIYLYKRKYWDVVGTIMKGDSIYD